MAAKVLLTSSGLPIYIARFAR